MQLNKLNITSFKHLENINFDFTYPENHSKAGKPLEKICLIGQSATGKTSLLELIRETISKLDKIEIINNTHLWNYSGLDFKGSIEFDHKNKKLYIDRGKIVLDNREFKLDGFSGGGGTIGNLFTDELKLIYFSSDIISKETIDFFNQNPININLDYEKPNLKLKENKSTNYIYEFKQEVNKEIWFKLLYKILEYRKKFTQMAAELINKGAIGDMNKLNKHYAKWAENNENPLIKFAYYFDPILLKLNLKIDLVNTEYAIPIKSLINDDVIPVSSLSTGTKGLLLSMFPLFELDTNNSIILIDEPERSLFPDIQMDLIKHYKVIAPSSQLIIATHSPFIAASFEPEERFILNFNEDGKIEVQRGKSPIGDDPNDILTNDFNINYYNDYGKIAYEKYLNLKKDIVNEKEIIKKKALMIELAELGDKYNF